MQRINLVTTDQTVTIDLTSDEITLLTSGNIAPPQESTTTPADNKALGKLEWSKTLADGEELNYEAAEKAVQELGEGWRLPTRAELESILDLSRHNPAIDTDRFPGTESDAYWTSTPYAPNKAAVWVVYFNGGSVDGYHRYDDACVRAVRSGQ